MRDTRRDSGVKFCSLTCDSFILPVMTGVRNVPVEPVERLSDFYVAVFSCHGPENALPVMI